MPWGKQKKHRAFCIPIEKEIVKTNKEDSYESVVTASCKVKFIDNVRFVAASLSNLVDNLREITQKIKRKNCGYFLKQRSVKDNLIKYKCSSCNKIF